MRRPFTRSRARALEMSRCKLCCREVIAIKPLSETSKRKLKPRVQKVTCTSFIPRDIFEAGILKLWHSDKKLCGKNNMKCAEQLDSAEVEMNDSVMPELPDEVWLKIFKILLSSGQYPTMHRIQLVCRRWHWLSRNPMLWQNVDLSCAGTRWIPYRDSSLEWLCKHRLDPVQKLNLHGWHCLTSEGLQNVAKHCPKLISLELAYCSHINRDSIYTLTKYCKDLSHINLASTTSDVVCVYPMVHLAHTTGPKLKSLDLSGNLLHGFNTVINAICVHCPNLEELVVACCRGDMLNMDVELWQQQLPSMRVFSINYSFFQTVQVPQPSRSSPGWPKLEELCLAMSISVGTKVPVPLDDALLRRFLSRSESLQKLDVRGRHNVSAQLLLNLPLPSLRNVELGVLSDSGENGLAKFMEKYGPQLEEVNLSWTNYSQNAIRCAVQALIQTKVNHLRLLFLARTSITMEDIVHIMIRRPNLMYIELKDCPSLPHEWRKLFNSDMKMRHLHKLVNEFMKRTQTGRSGSVEEQEEEEEGGRGEEKAG